MAPHLLDQSVWTLREQAHRARADSFLATHRPTHDSHPVWDFLFTYYSLRPRQLRRWHPGYGVALAGREAERYLDRTGYRQQGSGVSVTSDYLRGRIDTLEFVAGLMRATSSRAPRLNCFGLHEWAMVYRSPEVRHGNVALRLGATGTDTVVESMPLRCSHFDAYRFFTDPAVPRNADRLTREGQAATEQPGCLHASMDLYKWAYKLGPLAPAEFVMDCLELAADARAVDMRASPYDLRAHGFEPIAVETATGRAEYVRAQQDIADRAEPLRVTLGAHCDRLLGAVRAR